MEPPIVISSQERVSATTVNIQPRASSHQELMKVFLSIVDSFYPVFPFWEFVKFIKNQKLVLVTPFFGQDSAAVFVRVPVKILPCGFFQQPFCQGCFSTLSWTA